MVVYDEEFFTNGGDLGGYDNYNNSPSRLKTNGQLIAELERAGIEIRGKKVLDIGCAHGFLVEYLVELGADAYGMDSSEYAVSQASPEIADRIILGDVTVEDDFIKVATAARLEKGEKFDLIIDQDMIMCLDDAGAKICCSLAKKYGSYIIHFLGDSPHIDQWYNYHTIDEWAELSGRTSQEKWTPKPGWSEK